MTDGGIRERAVEIFEELGLQGGGLAEAWLAFDANSEGTLRAAEKASEGRAPGGLFLHLIRQGEHLKTPYKRKRRTGWRYVRGTHSGTYVKDPKGTDRLPAGHEQ